MKMSKINNWAFIEQLGRINQEISIEIKRGEAINSKLTAKIRLGNKDEHNLEIVRIGDNLDDCIDDILLDLVTIREWQNKGDNWI
jgi:hypothetical protein